MGSEGKIVFEKKAGDLSIFPTKEPVTDSPIYDLASLTKPLVTSFLTLKLLDDGEISLDKKISDFFPGFFSDVRIIHLLTHTSGLPAWYPLYLYGDDYLKRLKILAEDIRPGRKVIYSCPGYILLTLLLENVYGCDIGKASSKFIFSPLNLKDTFFSVPSEKLSRTAPTEKGNMYEKKIASELFPERAAGFKWRREVIRGECNDGNAFYFGRACGNAGLFSTAKDLFKLSGEFFENSAALLSSETVRFFWKNFTPFKRSFRTAGFKLNYSPASSGGRAMSFNAVGHNGFTGTSLWLDRKKNSVYIILSNRIHPHVKQGINFNSVRRKIHRLMKKEVNISGI